jgi:outer membrane protein insertion porin family
VQEGSQYRIAGLGIKGNAIFGEPQLRELIKSRAGGIFSREGLQSDVVAITDKYADRGYLFADVVPVSDIKRDTTTVDVVLEIVEGPQAYIRRIEIAGNARTRDKVIRRELTLVEGDVFSSSQLTRARRNLENLNYFDEVKLDTKRTTAPDQVDLFVDLKEKATGAFTLGGGFSSVDGAIGVASVSQNNLLGLGKRASLSGQIGQNANRINAVYTDPHLLDSDLFLELRGYDDQLRYEQNTGFNQDSLGGALTLGHHLFEEVVGSVTYGWERIRITVEEANRPFVSFLTLRAADQGATSTSSITLALVRDTRDSFLEPTKGLRLRVAGSYAGGPLGADNNFMKYTGEASQYYPLPWKMVGHLRGSLAYGEGLGETDQLPVQERLFLGGPASVRGFRNLTISPKDPVTGGLEGGNLAWFGNAEIIFPLYDPVRLKGLVFFDVGQVYATDIQDKFGDITKRNIKRSAGIGIRFNSPLGAIRLEWGFNLNREQGERLQVLHFSAGTTF